MLDLTALESEISDAYEARKAIHPPETHLGWRLLYGPPDVVKSVTVAFVGTNPGGRLVNPAHGTFAMARGSAYDPSVEDWGPSSKLQRQALEVFARLGVAPDSVLAGNIVPFRSPSWPELPDRQGAVEFGRTIWKRLFASARPSLVISMGNETHDLVRSILDVREIRRHSVNWGNISAQRGVFEGGIWIGLPHLSRFSIMTRGSSRPALDALFAGLPDLRA